jgi:hypothetical protein
VFLDDAIPTTLGTAGNQDAVVCLRPTDLIFLEGQPQIAVFREPLSGVLGARIQFHASVAAITNKYPTGIATVTGTGLVPQANY